MILLLASGLAVPLASAGWEAPEGTPYDVPSREVVATPSARSGLQFRDGVLAWIDSPWNGTGAAAQLAYLDTRTGRSGNVRADGLDALANSSRAGEPSVSGSHVAWVRYPEPGAGQLLNPWQPGGAILALAIGDQPILLHPADADIVTAPHLDGARVAWGSSQPGSDPRPTVHLADLTNGTRVSARFPLPGRAEAWPLEQGVLVLRTTGNEAEPGGLYRWDFANAPVLLTPEPARGIQVSVAGALALWAQYREGGRGTDIHAFDLATLREARLTLSPGRESAGSASGDLVAWADLRSEPDCQRGGCQPSYNLYFADRATGNEYKLEGTWGVSAGPALDGRELAYGDAAGRLRIATLPGPDDLLVAKARPVIAESGSPQLGPPPPGTPQPPRGAQVLEVRLETVAPMLQRWDRDLDGEFETEGPLQVVVEGNRSPIDEAFGYAVDAAGRVAALGVNLQELLAEALAAPPDRGLGDPPVSSAPDGGDGNVGHIVEAGGGGRWSDVSAEVGDTAGDGGMRTAPGLASANHAAPEAGWHWTPTATATVTLAGLGFGAMGAAAFAQPWLRRLLPLALFSRLRSEDALEHPARRQIASLVADNPGIHYQELVRRVGRGRGVVEHHLASLVGAGVVMRVRQGRYACHFHRDARAMAGRVPFGALKAAGARNVMAALAREQRQGQELAAELGLSPTTVSYHLRRLAEAGLVERQGQGARVRYAVSAAGRRAVADGLAGPTQAKRAATST